MHAFQTNFQRGECKRRAIHAPMVLLYVPSKAYLVCPLRHALRHAFNKSAPKIVPGGASCFQHSPPFFLCLPGLVSGKHQLRKSSQRVLHRVLYGYYHEQRERERNGRKKRRGNTLTYVQLLWITAVYKHNQHGTQHQVCYVQYNTVCSHVSTSRVSAVRCITLGRSNDSRFQNDASPSLNSGTT